MEEQKGTSESELNLTLVRKSRPVVMMGPDGGQARYTLSELTGAERDKYLNGVQARAKFVKGKAAGVTSYDGLMASLLVLCLRDDAGKLLSLNQVQAFPASTQAALFSAAQELNGMKEEGKKSDDEEDEKNV